MGPARLSLGTTPLRLFSLRQRDSPSPSPPPSSHPFLAETWQRGEDGEGGRACRHTQRAEPDSGREGEGSCRLCLPAPTFEVKEKAKAFHISADVQLEQDSKRKDKAGGTGFPALSRVHTRSCIKWGGGDAAFPAHTTIYFSPAPTPKFRVEGNNFLTLATIHYVYGSAPHPIPPLFPVLMKGKNVLLSFFIFPDW